mmetsp:Transcript_18507/g.45863  ORF Transcript_18507/g.45863 Transcript_18507/m.45863 type:complete len:145 (+) Transcript_18507:30-464(+)
MYSKSFLLLLLILVANLSQNDAQTRKAQIATTKMMVTGKEGPQPTQKKYLRKANAPTVNVIGGGRHSHVRYTKKTRSSSTSVRAPGVDSPKLFTIRRPEVPPQKTTPEKKALSKKKPQKGSSRKTVLTFEKPLVKTGLTMKQRA